MKNKSLLSNGVKFLDWCDEVKRSSIIENNCVIVICVIVKDHIIK